MLFLSSTILSLWRLFAPDSAAYHASRGKHAAKYKIKRNGGGDTSGYLEAYEAYRDARDALSEQTERPKKAKILTRYFAMAWLNDRPSGPVPVDTKKVYDAGSQALESWININRRGEESSQLALLAILTATCFKLQSQPGANGVPLPEDWKSPMDNQHPLPNLDALQEAFRSPSVDLYINALAVALAAGELKNCDEERFRRRFREKIDKALSPPEGGQLLTGEGKL